MELIQRLTGDKFSLRWSHWPRRARYVDGTSYRIRHRDIFILPTRNGLLFAATIVLMLLGSINYGISMGYALTFLMVGVGLNAMWRTHRNLHRLKIGIGRAKPVFAGESADFVLELDNLDESTRSAIGLRYDHWQSPLAGVHACGSVPMSLRVPAKRRGILKPGRFSIFTCFPTGLFYAWAWIVFDMRVLVYPKPIARPLDGNPTADRPGADYTNPRDGDGDFDGLREYQPSDSPKHLAWKAMARQGKLLTKQFHDQGSVDLWLEWDSLPGDGPEDRLSILCFWLLEAESGTRNYGLRIPGQTVAPARGESHQTRCLEAVALYGLGNEA